MNDYIFTDAHIAERMTDDALRGKFLFARGLGWLEWTGTRWRRTDASVVQESGRRWMLSRYEEALVNLSKAVGTSNSKQAEYEVDQWRTYSTHGRVRGLVEDFCRGILHEDGENFDKDPDVLNVANGVVDLR